MIRAASVGSASTNKKNDRKACAKNDRSDTDCLHSRGKFNHLNFQATNRCRLKNDGSSEKNFFSMKASFFKQMLSSSE